MTKMISLVMALVMALIMIPAVAEESGLEQDMAGIWGDEQFDRMELVIIPSEVAWFDERMGEESSAQKYVAMMTWPSSESEVSVYNIVGTLDETGRILSYEGGMFAEYTFNENYELDEEETGLLEDNGTGTFTLTDDGVLLWQDSYLAEAKEMKLVRQVAPAPEADEIKAGYYQRVLELGPDAAGASLRLAQAVSDVFQFCLLNPFWCMDQDAFAQNLVAAQNALTAEEKAVFDANRGALSAELVRLLDEKEEMGGDYADAGVEAMVDDLRNDPGVRLSVETFIFAVETLNEIP